MTRIALLALLMISLPLAADDSVAVPGSEIRYVPKVQQKAKGQLVEMSITGTALRTKTVFNVKVYSIASYIHDGAAVKTAEDLAAAEKAKLLHIVMERKVSGTDFVDAFRTAVGEDRAKNEFGGEFKKLTDSVGTTSADKGEYVLLLYVPDVGTRIIIGDKVDVTIPGQAFGRAIWDIYVGKAAVDEDMKKNLVSQIK